MLKKLYSLFRSIKKHSKDTGEYSYGALSNQAHKQSGSDEATNIDYEKSLQEEIDRYAKVENVHDLPPIFGYWSNKYLTPMLEECGVAGIDEFYAKYLYEAAERVDAPTRFISIGAGNCDTEVRVAKLLIAMGLKEFTFECLELNPHMIERGKKDAANQGLRDHFLFIEGDFNTWTASAEYAGVMANHSLHHVVNLEHLFDEIKSALHPLGYFITSDMIGRNGHQRWPEALIHVNRLWEEIPDSYRYNQLLKRHEAEFDNWDCSSEGFEGIRAQDILPLLVERFNFLLFIGFANVINPFVDRCFGHNFDASSPADQAFIDRVHAIDEEGFKNGELKPTQALAVMTKGAVAEPIYSRGLTPQFSIRQIDDE